LTLTAHLAQTLMSKENRLRQQNIAGYFWSGKVVVEPTYRCNLNCSMCFYDKNYSADETELSMGDFIEFLQGQEGVNMVILPGREPMMKENFFDLIVYLRQRRIPYVLLTNGLLINKNNYERLLNRHKSDKIYLSIDGDKETHNKIRGSAMAYQGVVAAAKLLAGKVHLCMVCTISETNIGCLWRVPRIIREIGLDNLIFEYERRYTKKIINDSEKMMGAGGFELLKRSDRGMPRYSLHELEKNIQRMEKEAKKSEIRIEYLPEYFREMMPDIYYRRLRKKKRLTCRYLKNPRIDLAGNIIHCFAYRKPFGNIKQSCLEEIWDSKPYRDFRTKLVANNLMPICETCWGAIPID
jgi:MoaA/NifB/PqqE/SkfB family radical SAM enzyme